MRNRKGVRAAVLRRGYDSFAERRRDRRKRIAYVRKGERSGTPCWYVTEEKAETGDTALVPYGKNGSLVRGEILKVEICSRQTAPYPMNRIRAAEKIFPKE